MTKRETVSNADYINPTRQSAKSDSRFETGVWKTRVRGQAVCCVIDCEHKSGTFNGQARTTRAFDYTSAEIERRVNAGLAAYCPDTKCQLRQDRDARERRKIAKNNKRQLLASRAAAAQANG